MIPAMRNIAIFLLIVLGLSACASSPPRNTNDLCAIFTEKRGWYGEAKKAADKWRGNIHVPMAIMHQESRFEARAKPPMRFFLGFIPYGRASDAYGYPQALESTWAAYQKSAGSMLSQRSDFGDAIDFIQWYMHQTWRENKVPKTDAYRHYLNYHEGQGGYRRGTYQRKKWLINVAKRVDQRAKNYQAQLKKCEARLPRSRWW